MLFERTDHTHGRRGFAWAQGMRHNFAGPGRRGHRHGHGHGGFAQSERGSVKYDVLAILLDGPRHGYEIMLAIEERRGFRPSPGSIYPALQMLADGDFVSSREVDGKRIYEISDAGRTLLATYRETPRGAEESGEPTAGAELMMRGVRTLAGLKDAVKQLARSGDVNLIGQGVEILDRARRELYTLLAQEK